MLLALIEEEYFESEDRDWILEVQNQWDKEIIFVNMFKNLLVMWIRSLREGFVLLM